jgi:hypothetical protein
VKCKKSTALIIKAKDVATRIARGTLILYLGGVLAQAISIIIDSIATIILWSLMSIV